MRLIDISTPKYPNTFTMVDDADYEWLNQWKWRAALSGRSKTCYAIRTIKAGGQHTVIAMHTEILRCKNQTDHIDTNGLNNQRSNLRAATPAQNCQNRRKPISGTSSKYKGVHWHKRSQKFRAQIKTGGKITELGRFSDDALAARAYDAAAKELFGEYANLNFPDPSPIPRGSTGRMG